MLLEKPTSNWVGSWGGCARAKREHIGGRDEQKISMFHATHEVVEHLTVQHAFQHQTSRARAKGVPI